LNAYTQWKKAKMIYFLITVYESNNLHGDYRHTANCRRDNSAMIPAGILFENVKQAHRKKFLPQRGFVAVPVNG
jgi:hypothetical protein